MENINFVVQAGNLVRDPELKYSNGGMEILNFSIAVNSSKKVGETWEDEPNFFNCVMFGKRASGVVNYLHKGSKVTVSGKLKQERWEKDGQAKSKIVIIVNSLELPPKGASSQGQSNNDLDDDNIPFD